MPWSSSEVTERELRRRLAYYIDKRVTYGKGSELVEAGIVSHDTLGRIRRWRDPAIKHYGPSYMDAFIRICRALGDSPGKVMFAAESARSENCFWRHLQGTYKLEEILTVVTAEGTDVHTQVYAVR